MFAVPVKAKNVEYSHVDNNGHAMAPYMMSVGLFVACMAFTLMYPLMEKNEEVKSGLQWWLSKVTVMAAVSIAQAVIMVAVLMGINGLEPHYVGKTFGMNEVGSAGLIATLANNIAMFNMIGDMNEKSKIINIAFAVSASFTFGDHLAFTAGVNPKMIVPVIVGKLTAGCTAFLLASALTSKLLVKIQIKK